MLTPSERLHRVVGLALLLVAGCGHDAPEAPRRYVAQVLSDPQADGDITYSPAGSAFTITQAVDTGNLVFGVDGRSANPPESRAFIDFPLDGSTGDDALPANARVLVADVQVFVDSVTFTATVPTLLDLVPFQIPLSTSDFDSSPLSATATRGLDFYSTDAGSMVQLDVTDLLTEALARGLRDFQLRLLLDPDAPAGVVQLADGPSATAPLLYVEYE